MSVYTIIITIGNDMICNSMLLPCSATFFEMKKENVLVAINVSELLETTLGAVFSIVTEFDN